MKDMTLKALVCFALLVIPSLAAPDALKRPIEIDVENVGRTLKASERIAYGQRAAPGQFPFMARIAWVANGMGYTACGGTVIAPNYILTAAHCMYDQNNAWSPPNLVLLGGTDISAFSNFPERLSVAEAFVPTQYVAGNPSSNYDVAVLRLKTPTSAPAVTLTSTAPPAGTSITSIGWGYTEKSALGGPQNDFLYYTGLRVGTLGVAPCPRCPTNPCTILCETGLQQSSGGFTSACQGDSGGPQILDGTTTQVSIVSFGPEGCGTDIWGASTSVAVVKSWIDGIVGSSTPQPSPSPTPSPSPSPSPSPQPIPSPEPSPTPTPTPIPSPKPTPTPTPTGCKLDQTKGDIVQITYKTTAGCTADVTKASATAAAQSSGASSYCIVASKCTKLSGGRIKVSAKLAVNIDRTKAKANIGKAFSNGMYYARFKAQLPGSYSKYTPQTGGACVYPGLGCTY